MIKFSTKDDLLKTIELEQKSINLHISSQISLSNELVSSINSITENNFNDFTKYIINIKNNIGLFNTLNEKLDILKEENNDDKIKYIINDYNQIYVSSINNIFSSNLEIKRFIDNLPTNNENINVENKINNITYLENTLLISEVAKVVILPYTLKALNEKLSTSSEYKNINEIINEEYTIPLVYYKHTAICRFKEAMKLALNKDKTSYFKALSLAIECLTNYNLHPAIITACNSLDDLDIYLSCLEDNQLDDFKIFNIKYEMLPKVVKVKDNIITQNT